ncbi:hypothetical protein E1B28_007092 [Marasmius oreades]|uniref:Uncharacterized protein n=1 Tax=Marasmius oreades TaxID=181124 RepID=A0A9P7UTP2_9AGAR|nr:uncharacterized protein E1B28_007092 [Marasmius oreades]KAG7093410.1 hypothetical protein E1B28_007092 [Marasmius oreades]
MDPLSLLTSVISTAKFLINWIDARKSQECTLSDIQNTIRNVHESVLCSLLEKSKAQLLDSRILGPLETLHDILRRTQAHLVDWEQSRLKPIGKLWTTINPWAILDRLKADEKKLMISVQILGTAMIAIYTPTQATNTRKTLPVDISSNADLRTFWTSELGEEVSYCSAECLALALGRHLNVQLKAQASHILASRLDEFGVGCVTLVNLDTFIGRRSILEAIMDLGVVQDAVIDRKTSNTTTIVPPILVVVDDNPCETMGYARALSGVDRHVFESTAAAKTWFEKNEVRLRQADQMNRLRIVSDNVRWEKDVDSCDQSRSIMNLRAGETILRYLRGRQYKAPVLIFANSTIPMTQYVCQYSNAGSTRYPEVLSNFLDGFANLDSKADDGWWRSYAVEPKWSAKPLLIWVDDGIDGLGSNIECAKSVGIEVVPFSTIDDAKVWITSNEILLRRMEGAHLLRFISDNTKMEGPFYEGGPRQLNRGAGKQFLEFVRLNRYLSPLLITCHEIDVTLYVCDHENAGSTRTLQVLRSYLSCFSEGRTDDSGWKGCGP